VTEGPFKDLRPDYKSNDTHPHCLERDFYPVIPQANLQEMLGFGYNPTVIAGINANNDFLSFHSTLLRATGAKIFIWYHLLCLASTTLRSHTTGSVLVEPVLSQPSLCWQKKRKIYIRQLERERRETDLLWLSLEMIGLLQESDEYKITNP
jgi:hypothetical protein